MSLRTLARLYGVQTAYYGINRQRHEASAEALLATLRGLGAPLETVEDVPTALREKRIEAWSRMMEPVIVAWQGESTPIELRLPAKRSTGSLRFQIVLEDGSCRLGTRRLSSLRTARKEAVDGTTYLCKHLVLPSNLPTGYHNLTVETPTTAAKATLVCAPLKAYTPPNQPGTTWGTFAPLYALHTNKSWGAGDFSDMEAFVDWTASLGGKVVSTLPFLAAFLDNPHEPSPYSPASRLFWNELYVDPTRSREWERCSSAQRQFNSVDFQKDLRTMRASKRVDYRRLYQRKREVLESLAAYRFGSANGGLAELDDFVDSRPLLKDYARFRATMEHLELPWMKWPAKARQGNLEPNDYRQKDVRYHLYAQWLAHQQISSMSKRARRAGAGMYLDLPLGVHPFGFDVWREQELFVTEASVGAPPDPVFTGGQDWSFPPLHPEVSRKQGHRYFAACIQHQLEKAGLLRIDHVMGLHRMFWIPRGFDFKDGIYVHYPAEELYAILCLESHRHRSVIVGENLGIVPDYVNRAMSRHNIQPMFLMQYSLRPDPARPMKPIPSGSVASLNSHDTPLFSAFWQAMDIEDRLDLGFLDARSAKKERRARTAQKRALLAYFKNKGLVQNRRSQTDKLSSILGACLARLRRSRASMVLVNVEDLWLETKPQNVPGSGRKRPNWQRKTRYSLERFSKPSKIEQTLKLMDAPTPRTRDERPPSSGGTTP